MIYEHFHLPAPDFTGQHLPPLSLQKPLEETCRHPWELKGKEYAFIEHMYSMYFKLLLFLS